MAKGNIVVISDVGGFCSGNLELIKKVYAEAKQILPIFSEYNSPRDFLENLGYSIEDRTKEAYLLPLNHARLDALDHILYDDHTPLLGPNATEKQIKDVVALLKTEKADIEHQIKAELDNFAEGSIADSKEDLKNAMRAATAQQIREVVPSHLREKYKTELDTFAAYLDDGVSHSSESGHVSLIKNEAGNVELSEYAHKGLPIVLAAALAYTLSQIFGGAGGNSKEVVHESEVQYDATLVGANDTPDNQDQRVLNENIPDWLIPKKNLLGEEYFEIDREKLPLEADGWHVKRDNNEFNNDKIKPGNGVAEMIGGILDGKAVVIVDEDVFAQYGGDFAVGIDKKNDIGVRRNDCIEIAPGLFLYDRELEGHNLMSAGALFPISRELPTKKKNNGAPKYYFAKI